MNKQILILFSMAIVTTSAALLLGCASKYPVVQKAPVIAQENADLPLNLIFSPNPVKDEMTISFNYQWSAKGSVRMFDLLGKEVQQKAIEVKQGSNSIQLNLGDLLKGIYIVEVYAGNRQVGIRRVTKE